MEVAAKLKGAKISAQKARLVADQIRGPACWRRAEYIELQYKEGRAPGSKVARVCDSECRAQ